MSTKVGTKQCVRNHGSWKRCIHIIFRRRKGRDLPYLRELPLLRITEGNWVGLMGEISVMDCDSMCETLSD